MIVKISPLQLGNDSGNTWGMILEIEAVRHRPEQVFEYGGRTVGVGVGQVGFSWFAGDAQMDEFAQATGQAIADLPQGVGLSHLAEQHRGQLGPSK